VLCGGRRAPQSVGTAKNPRALKAVGKKASASSEMAALIAREQQRHLREAEVADTPQNSGWEKRGGEFRSHPISSKPFYGSFPGDYPGIRAKFDRVSLPPTG
jgi:hypothetical protein